MKEHTSIPMRRCAGCQRSFPKETLIRIAGSDGKAGIDMADRMPGRGIYLCRSKACIDMAEKKRALGRGLHMELSAECAAQIFSEAREMINSGTK